MEIKEIIEPRQKQAIAREILEALPEWFGIPQAREQYIAQSAGQPFFAALQEERPIGFCCLMPTGRDTVELAVRGVRWEYHRRGIGRALAEAAREHAAAAGYSFLQVKTVQMGRYREFDEATASPSAWAFGNSRFSRSCGTKGSLPRCTSWHWNNSKTPPSRILREGGVLPRCYSVAI